MPRDAREQIPGAIPGHCVLLHDFRDSGRPAPARRAPVLGSLGPALAPCKIALAEVPARAKLREGGARVSDIMALTSRAPEADPRVSEAAELVALRTASAGRTDAPMFRKLVHENLDVVWRSLRRFGVHEADVDDATQRVFLIANDKLATIESGRERAFLIGIAARVASHARRADQRRRLAEQRLSDTDQAATPNPEELAQQLEMRVLLDRVLDALPRDLRTVFVLFELEELSLDEIARCLELPRGTAATRLRRARELFSQSAKSVSRDNGRRFHNG